MHLYIYMSVCVCVCVWHTHTHTYTHTHTHIYGSFNKFQDLFCTGIQNYSRHLKIHYVIAIHLLRWLISFYDFRFKWTVIAGIGIHPTKAWLSQLVNFKNAIWTRGQFPTLPIVQTLLSVTFAYSLSSETVVMRQLRRWKSLWRRSLTRSRKRTSMGPSRSCWNGTTGALQQEEITSKGTRV